MSNDPRVDALVMGFGFLERRVDTLEREVEKQSKEIQRLKKCLKIDPNVLRNIVYNKNKGDKKV